MRRLLFWLLEHVPLGPLAPYVVALAMGRAAHDIQKEDVKKMERILTLIGVIVAVLYVVMGK